MLLGNDMRRIYVEVNPKKNANAVYDLLDMLNLPPYKITQAEIKVSFSATPSKHAHTRKFKIRSPNWCALRHDDEDAIIRQMLAYSGIEPRLLNKEDKDYDV